MCLGVNKRSLPECSSQNELGRLPLKQQISQNILKFWIHLENRPNDSIAKLCLIIFNNMALENKTGLTNKINSICTKFDIDKNSVYFCDPSPSVLSDAEKNIFTNLKNHQLNLVINTNKKLKFYSVLKMKRNTSIISTTSKFLNIEKLLLNSG